MTKLFRNSSPGALTLNESIELEKKREKERRKQMRQARELAAQGRGEDTEVAHVALGELVVPQALQTPELLAALRRVAAANNIPFDALRVGSAMNSRNPRTGAPEFGAWNNARYNSERSTDPTSPLESSLEGFMHGFTAPARGVGELIANTSAPMFEGGQQAKHMDEVHQKLEDDYQMRRAAAGRSGFDIARTAGEIISGYALGRTIPKVATYAGATALGAAEGAIDRALTPVPDPTGPYWKQKAEQIQKGVFTGALEGRAKYLGKRAKDWFGY